MATNLSIEPALLDKALDISDEKTKKAVVTQALVEYIVRRTIDGLSPIDIRYELQRHTKGSGFYPVG